MKTFKLDSDNNIVFGTDIVLLSEKEALIQDIRNLLLMFKGEYPFDINKGIDYYDLASFNDNQKIQNAVRDRILQDERVKTIENLTISQERGNISVSAEINSIYGEINV